MLGRVNFHTFYFFTNHSNLLIFSLSINPQIIVHPYTPNPPKLNKFQENQIKKNVYTTSKR